MDAKTDAQVAPPRCGASLSMNRWGKQYGNGRDLGTSPFSK